MEDMVLQGDRLIFKFNRNMNEANSLSVIDGAQTITSLEIAEVTGKQHSHVMRDIRSILKQGVSESNFGLSSRKQPQPNGGCKEIHFYSLTPKGCLILASGYDALLREKIINRLEDLEKSSKPSVPQTYLDALKSLVASEEQKQQLALENKRQALEIEVKDAQITELNATVRDMQPKASYVDTILQCKDTVQVTVIAQDYGKSAKAFNILLRNFGIQRKVGTSWVLYGKYIADGYVQSKTFTYRHSDGTDGARKYTEWTQKGRLFLYNTLKEHGILPLIEQTA